MKEMIKRRKTGIFLFVTTVVHLSLGSYLNLTDDGAYYWVWSRYLNTSYYDHPPMIAYLIRVFTSIFGNNNFAVRLTPVLAILITSIYIYKIIYYLYSDKNKAFLGIVLFNVMPIFSVLSFMTMPDAPLMVFYTIGLYYFIRVIYERKPYLWYLVGLMIGLGLLSKYNMFLVYPGIFFYLLLNREERYWFKKKELYLSFLLSLFIFLPVIIWNSQHNWASFFFHLVGRNSSGFSIKPDLFITFLLIQVLLIVTPIIFISFSKVIKNNYHKKDVKLLLYYGLPILLIFMAVALVTEYKLHWTALAYIPLIIMLAGYQKWSRSWKYAGIGFALIITLLLYAQSIYPFLPLKPADDITTDLHGWDVVGREVQDIYNSLETDDWFLFSNRYQLAAQLQFYLPEHNYVYSINKRTEQYDYWQDEKKLYNKNGIYVTHSFYLKKPTDIYGFDNIKLMKKINITRVNKVYRTFYIYKCNNFKGVK